MKPALATECAQEVVCCHVAAYGAVRAGAAQIAAWRRQPPLPPGLTLPANFLKNSDPQTIAGLAALYLAIQDHSLLMEDSLNWGVIAAPTFLGRSALAMACQRFAVEGAWAISPNLIPHHSLHAVSGTISHALNLRGPNYGIGGGSSALAEGFVMAATLLADELLPGLWLILTGYDPELVPLDPDVPDQAAPLGPEPLCHAAALALKPATSLAAGLQLHIGAEEAWLATQRWPILRLTTLTSELVSPTVSPAGCWRLETGGWIALEPAATDAEKTW